MKEIILHKYNSKFIIKDFSPKKLNPDQIRIKTAYAGISFTDVIIRKGLYKYQKENNPLPLTLGFEASGTVLETGSNVDNISIGENVVVLRRFGCFSSEIIANGNEVIKIPNTVPLDIAASLPVNFFTAWHALHNIVNIFPNSKILITSAGGGVGGMLTQLASPNHQVTGLVGLPTKINYVTSLGAQRVYTYKTYKYDSGYDVIFNSRGNCLKEYENVLTINGKMINYGFHELIPDKWIHYPKLILRYLRLPKFNVPNLVYGNKTIAGFNIIKLKNDSCEYLKTRKAFEKALIEGNLQTPSITKFEYQDVEKAFVYLESKTSVGKIILKF